MKTPRTFKIIGLMRHVIARLLSNETIGLGDSLNQLDELGGIYIKFLQMVVLSSSGINQRNFVELLKVYEDSKPDQIDIWRHLEKIKMPNRHLIAEIEIEPFATGSFGQVYRAKLTTGEEVIIKALRPSVEHYLAYDLRLLYILCAAFSLIDKHKMLNFLQIYKQFKTTCLQEIHYKREAEIADSYYKKYKDHPRMVIPKTYLEISNDKVIVQEYIDGLSLAKLLALQREHSNAREYVLYALNSDLFEQLETIGIELLSKALMGELFQADPHPGNIILLENNKVALIDFGMAAVINENRLAFYELLLQYQAYYSDNFHIEEMAMAALKYLSPKLYSAIAGAEHILDSSNGEETLLDKLKRATLKVANEDSTKTVIDSMLQQNLIMKVLFFELNRSNRFGFNFDIRAVNLLKATQGYMTLIAQFQGESTEIITVVMDTVIEYVKQNMDRLIDGEDTRTEPLESLEILSTWFDKMSRNDPWLTNQLMGTYFQ